MPGPTAGRMTASRTGTLRTLFGGGLALAAAMGIGRFAYTPILPVMQRSVGFSTGTAGLLASANYAGYLAGALLIAVAPPRVPRRPILVGCLIAVGITTGLMAVAADPLTWGVIRFLSGIASAGVFVLASGLVLGALRRRGRIAWAGWLYAGVGLGIATSGFVVRAGTGALGWRGDWLALAAVALAAVYPCWRWLPRPDPALASPSSGQGQSDRAPGDALALLFVAYFLEAVGYIVTGTFLVAIVNRTPGREATGANVWVVVGVAAVPAAILWTAAATRLGLTRALALAYSAQACGILLPIAGGVVVDYASAMLFGGTFIGITALTLTLAGRLAPHRTAELIGLLTAAYGVGQIIGPVLAASLASSAHSFTPALIAAAAIVLIGGMLMIAFEIRDTSEHSVAGRKNIASLRRKKTPGSMEERPPLA
jgi:predicted MFS family arabinose efflux permease